MVLVLNRLQDLRVRMVKIHEELRTASDLIKEARAAEQNLRRRSEVNPRTGQIKVGSYIRILRGSAADAAYLRKHGHGLTWKYRYKVLDVRPYAVLLEVPSDGSVPRISEWQLIRRCEPAPDEENNPDKDDPVLTERGIPLPEHVATEDSEADDVYDIEKILRAERVAGRYRLWIKWKGYSAATPMWSSELRAQSCNADLLKEIDDAIRRFREEVRDAPSDDPVEVPSNPPTSTTSTNISSHLTDSPSLPEKRISKPVDRYTATFLVLLCTDPGP